MKRLAFYGGSFDPVHLGHLLIGQRLVDEFELDEFIYIPAFHAPHKRQKVPTSAFDRYAMLCLATECDPKLRVSRIEIEQPQRPYTFQTLSRLRAELPGDEIFFVMGADSWVEVTTWYRWEDLLSLTNHIVVTRPGFKIDTDHVSESIRNRVIDRRSDSAARTSSERSPSIYLTDLVNLDISATSIREAAANGFANWRRDLPENVANYIEKYQIYS